MTLRSDLPKYFNVRILAYSGRGCQDEVARIENLAI